VQQGNSFVGERHKLSQVNNAGAKGARFSLAQYAMTADTDGGVPGNQRMHRRSLVGMTCVLLASAYGAARSGVAADQPKEIISNGGLMHMLEAAPVIGQPYSAIQVSRLVRTLVDGTTIKKGPGAGHAVMRDSSGRVRVEKRLSQPGKGSPGIVMVFVLDPVGHTLTTWSTGGKGEQVAVLIKLPAEKPRSQPAAKTAQVVAESARPQPIVTTENLGAEIIEGFPVDVVKTTTIVPPGRSGNDAPITKTHEVWTSQDLKLTMKEQWSDPRSGELTLWLTNFSRSDPDPAMFRAPAGYIVKDLKQTMQELAQRLAQMPD
jgi:hypothetical protein